MTITARYPGRCAKCGGKIRVGEEIEWAKGKAECMACAGLKLASAQKAKQEPKPIVRVEVVEEFSLNTMYGILRFGYRPEGTDKVLWGRDVLATGFVFHAFGDERFEVVNAAEMLPLALAAKARLTAERKATLAALEADITEGRVPIRLTRQEGEYLSGHVVTMESYDAVAIANRLLTAIGAAHDVSGWGTIVERKIVEGLGAEFAYPMVLELLRPEREAKEARKAKSEAARAAKFAEAKATGKPVALRSWTEECNDPDESCDVDSVTEWALPNGHTKTTRQHTW